MHPGPRYRFVAVHQIFTLAEGVQEDRHGTDVKRVRTEPKQVVEQSRDLIKQDADVLSA